MYMHRQITMARFVHAFYYISVPSANSISTDMGYAASKPLPPLPLPARDVPSSSESSSSAASISSQPPAIAKHRLVSSTSTTSYHTTKTSASRRSISTASTIATLTASTITEPSKQQREVHHLSYLIDPEDLDEDLGSGWKVRSPSGNLLGKTGYFCRDDRPLSLRERQERIKAGLANSGSEVASLGRSVSTMSNQTKTSKRKIEHKEVLGEKNLNVKVRKTEVDNKKAKKQSKSGLSCF